MDRLRDFLCFKSSSSVLLPTTRFFSKFPSWFTLKAKGYAAVRAKQGSSKKELVSLHRDMELCAGYADIKIMWEMVHSSYSIDGSSSKHRKRPLHALFCFKTLAQSRKEQNKSSCLFLDSQRN